MDGEEAVVEVEVLVAHHQLAEVLAASATEGAPSELQQVAVDQRRLPLSLQVQPLQDAVSEEAQGTMFMGRSMSLAV